MGRGTIRRTVEGHAAPIRHAATAGIRYQRPDPGHALAAEFGANGIAFHVPLRNRDDGLRGFEIDDPDGYVLFFGRPL